MRDLEINKYAVKAELLTEIVTSVNMKCALVTDFFLLFYNIN